MRIIRFVAYVALLLMLGLFLKDYAETRATANCAHNHMLQIMAEHGHPEQK